MPQTRLQVGDITVTAISDGILKTGLDVIRPIEPDECARLAGCAFDAPIWLPVNVFLIEIGGRKLISDGGSGTNMPTNAWRVAAEFAGGWHFARIDQCGPADTRPSRPCVRPGRW